MAAMGGGGAHGPVGTERNPIMCLLISGVCFLYAFVVWFGAIKELNAFRQKDEINPIMIFVPVLNLLTLWKLSEQVADAKQMAGVPNATATSPFLYLLLWTYFLPAELNEIWKAAGGQQ